MSEAASATGRTVYGEDPRLRGDTPPLPAIEPELANTYWGQLITRGWSNAQGTYRGGAQAPRPGEIQGANLDIVYRTGGTRVSEGDAAKLAKLGWTYGQPAPKGFEYTPQGYLKRQGPSTATDILHGLAGVGALTATALTAGAASPAVAAAVGGGTALAGTKLAGGTWRQALIAGGLGAAAGGLGASSVSQGTKIAGQAGIGAAQGANSGGGIRGALVGAVQGGGSAAAGGGTMPGGDHTGTGAAAASAPRTATLQDYLIQAALGAAAGAAGGGTMGALIGAGSGVAGAAQGTTNRQAAVNAGTSTASRILSGAQAATQAAGNAAAAREAGRQTETNNIVTQDQQRLSAAGQRENAIQGRAGTEINQRQEARAGMNDAYANALRSALAMHTQDVTANRPFGVPTISFSGGARPSAIGPEGRAAASLVNRRALDALENPRPLMELPAMESFAPSALPKANGVDTALGVAGTIGNALAGFQANQQANQRSSLIESLIQQAQRDANAGVQTPQVAAPHEPTLEELTAALGRRVSQASTGGYF